MRIRPSPIAKEAWYYIVMTWWWTADAHADMRKVRNPPEISYMASTHLTFFFIVASYLL